MVSGWTGIVFLIAAFNCMPLWLGWGRKYVDADNSSRGDIIDINTFFINLFFFGCKDTKIFLIFATKITIKYNMCMKN
jgi:hypothetical protein